jgi:hypothetical protein
VGPCAKMHNGCRACLLLHSMLCPGTAGTTVPAVWTKGGPHTKLRLGAQNLARVRIQHLSLAARGRECTFLPKEKT